jgi:hypothetical protein
LIITLFQSFIVVVTSYQGRRASRCSALAPGFHIPRLRRSVFVQRRPYDLFTDSLHLFYKFSLSLCLLIIDAPKLPTDNVESGSAGEPTGLNFETLGRIANA